MILKELKLSNIRTYENDVIKFPLGIMLFEGGIGAGKSTILLAIEFALFGLGEEKGNTLLSLGKNEGEIELAFEAGGRDYRVHRKLVRTKRGAGMRMGNQLPGAVIQDDCRIEHEGVVDRLSAKEMKERVLAVLGFNEPVNPKAKSAIFRYAVYTPQEEMKRILEDQELRLQTIRKALRLEDYKIAGDNAHAVATQLRWIAKPLITGAEKLRAIDEEIKRIEEGIPEFEAEITNVSAEMEDLEFEISYTKSEGEKLNARLESLASEARRSHEIAGDIKRLEMSIKALRQEIATNEERISKVKAQLEEIPAVERPPITAEEAESMLKSARSRLSDCEREAGMLSHELEGYSMLVTNGVCPTCGQPTDGEEFTSRLAEVRANVDRSNAQKRELEEEIAELEATVAAIAAHDEATAERRRLEERLMELKGRITNDGEQLLNFESQMEDLKERREKSKEAAEEYNRVKAEHDANERRRGEAEEKYKEMIRKKASLEGSISNARFKAEEVRRERERLISEKKRGEGLLEHADWLDGYFAAALEKIERAIMTAANRDFDAEFARWFAYLVEDPTKNVRVDEDFTPLISQDAYEQEIGNLSGGERTALALAYRLALNKVVRKNTDVDVSLLILDEPTDGFSKDQIAKMGDLLKELNIKQGIIVSHERELEGAVDHIFRVHKESGRSKVTALQA